MTTCARCNQEFLARSVRAVYCSQTCGNQARRAIAGTNTKNVPGVDLAPDVAVWLDALAAEFDRAIRSDVEYIIQFVREGSKVLDRRGDLAA